MADITDKYYLGAKSFELHENSENQDKLLSRLRQYLNLRNVSLLIGNGASLPIGAPSINSLNSIKSEFNEDAYKLEDDEKQSAAVKLIDCFLKDDHDIDLESFLGIVSHMEYDNTLLPEGQKLKLNDLEVT